MEDLSAFIIPRTLDDPEKILFFTYMEIGLLMFPLLTGLLFDFIIRGLVAGIVAVIAYRKLNPKNKGYSIRHLIYGYCPQWMSRFKVIPPSHIKIFI